jgi:VCBS repeat-containing protein
MFIESGTVALKVTNPDAKVSETIELISMDGHFGADIVLDMAGEYHFKLGTRLEDGTKRKYHFHYKNK